MRSFRRDTSRTSFTSKPLATDATTKPSASNLTRRRSYSDYRVPASTSSVTPTTTTATNTALKSTNKLGSGFLGSALGKFAQSKLVSSALPLNNLHWISWNEFLFHRKSDWTNIKRPVDPFAAKRTTCRSCSPAKKGTAVSNSDTSHLIYLMQFNNIWIFRLICSTFAIFFSF